VRRDESRTGGPDTFRAGPPRRGPLIGSTWGDPSNQLLGGVGVAEKAPQRWWQKVWSWPSPAGHGHAKHPDRWEDRQPGEAQLHPWHWTPAIDRRPYPPGARPSWFTASIVPRPGPWTCAIGGSALLNRFPDLPPKTVRPAFTGPYERRMMKSFVGRNRAIYQPLQMLPSMVRPEGQAVRHSQTPRQRPALVAPVQRYNKLEDADIVARARQRAFGVAGGKGRLGTRMG
jgi:hypothetical protein